MIVHSSASSSGREAEKVYIQHILAHHTQPPQRSVLDSTTFPPYFHRPSTSYAMPEFQQQPHAHECRDDIGYCTILA